MVTPFACSNCTLMQLWLPVRGDTSAPLGENAPGNALPCLLIFRR